MTDTLTGAGTAAQTATTPDQPPAAPLPGGHALASRAREVLDDWNDRVLASDPGLTRLGQAGRALVAVGSTIAVEYLFAHGTGATSLIAMLLGAVIAMMGSMGLSGPTVTGRLRTAVGFPVAVLIGLAAGAAVSPHQRVTLAGFVVVMIVAVQVRRFGPAFFMYGFQIWMGYFFASFLGVKFGQWSMYLEIVLVAAGWLGVVTLAIPPRPQRSLRRALLAFDVRVRRTVEGSASVFAHRHAANVAGRIRGRAIRVTETALIVEGMMASPLAIPDGWSAECLRQSLVDAELVGAHVSAALDRLAHLPTATTGVRQRAVIVARAVGGGSAEEVGATTEDLNRAARATGEAEVVAVCERITATSTQLLEMLHSLHEPPDGGPVSSPIEDGTVIGEDTVDTADRGVAPSSFAPAVTLFAGNLPGAAITARAMVAATPHRRWNPVARLDLISRQSVQVGLATTIAIIGGTALSPHRYYWAVIAAFVMFTGTTTVAETVAKGVNRVIGTLAGLVAAIALANLTAGHSGAAIAVILVAIALGFYLIRVSYGFMIFFITIMLAQLYSVLHEFTDALLVLRLEETGIGAAAGILTAIIILPVRGRDTFAVARAALLGALSDLLAATAQRLRTGTSSTEPDAAARAVDAQLHQLLQIARPAARPTLFGPDGGLLGRRMALWTTGAFHARNLVARTRDTTSFPRPAALALARQCDALVQACADVAARHPTRLPDIAEVLPAPDCLPPLVRGADQNLRHLTEVLLRLDQIGRQGHERRYRLDSHHGEAAATGPRSAQTSRAQP